jgi:hypothetical protein
LSCRVDDGSRVCLLSGSGRCRVTGEILIDRVNIYEPSVVPLRAQVSTNPLHELSEDYIMDFRSIISGLKMAVDPGRIADYAANIAKCVWDQNVSVNRCTGIGGVDPGGLRRASETT